MFFAMVRDSVEMSVGAPTWRGLKLVAPHEAPQHINMSVGAPTWRGLKQAAMAMSKRYLNVSRCPDMEGIETRAANS